MSTKKPAAAERRTGPAIDLFERAVKALAKKEYEKAREHFDDLIASYPEERDVAERARSYRIFCERALAESKRSPYKPKTFEDLLNHGVYLHNREEFEEALKVLRQATEMQPKHEQAWYCLAATSARAGDADGALKALRSAISAGAESRAHARRDPDFDAIRDEDDFVALVYAEAS
jgi:tetratricopeptide (TPR) repeat protein